MENSRRVVVTGVGMITPVGLDAPTSWAALVAGKSGAGRISRFDPSPFEVQIACEVKDFDPAAHLDYKEARRMDRFCQFAMTAVKEAMADSGLIINATNAERVGVIIGSGIGGIATILDAVKVMETRGPQRISPFAVPMLMADIAAGQVAITYGAKGPNHAVVAACATGTIVIGEAAMLIRHGLAEAMICGGSEAAIVPIALGGLGNMGALSKRNDEPEKASRPFDRDRDGFVMGEGAGILVLERLEHALARGARIYGEVAGYGATADAFHITAPAEGGEGAARAMQIALEQAGLAPEEVDYLNAHGTSTALNDVSETQAIKTVLGKHAYRVAISSTKSMVGHIMGAAGAVEGIAALLTLRDGVIHPTINLDNPDPQCDLDYVPHVARRAPVHVAMSNSFGFGGHNACVVFRRL
ncbi:MAG: beta-ketoacyl-ACP synthase II [Chloroflexi bacterium]|nr:beta-ketoacyl-ACP synthase II [Chloroflexota bacterium]